MSSTDTVFTKTIQKPSKMERLEAFYKKKENVEIKDNPVLSPTEVVSICTDPSVKSINAPVQPPVITLPIKVSEIVAEPQSSDVIAIENKDALIRDGKNQKWLKVLKASVSYHKRYNESMKAIKEHKGYIPVYIEKAGKSEIHIEKKKYIVPGNHTVGQFMFELRKRMNYTDSQKAIFLFVDNDKTIPCNSHLMSAIYEEYKDYDGFLYITYSGENAFGKNDF